MKISNWFPRIGIAPRLACVLAFGLEATVAATRTTGSPTDLAVDGAGWFVVRDAADNEMFATRRGEFRIDVDDWLVTLDGLRLQGFTDATLTTPGDLRLDATGAPLGADPTAGIRSFAFDDVGKLWVSLTDGTRFVRAQVLLQNFREPAKLTRAARRLYAEFEIAGPLPQSAAPGSLGLGLLRSGELDADPEPVRLLAWPAGKQSGILKEGMLTHTGRPTDVGLLGPGFFIVRDPATSERFATRAGAFLRDRDGWLITYQRLRVQGYADAELSVLGDVRIDGESRPATSDPAAALLGFSIDWSGRVWVQLSDGTTFVRSQILRRQFQQPGLLHPAGFGLFAGIDAAQPGEWLGHGRQYLLGTQSGALELVQLPEELLALRRTLADFPQGALRRTGVPTDLAVAGTGFFVVKLPGTEDWRVTRDGHFHLDADGYVLTASGWRLQGYADSGLTEPGDLRVDGQGRPATADPLATVVSFEVNRAGLVQVRLSDGSEFTRGQVLLQKFLESFALKAGADGTYTNVVAAGPLPQPLSPGTLDLGSIEAGAVEIAPIPENLFPPARDEFRLVASGEPGARWTLQESTNLQAWAEIASVTNTPGQFEFSAPGSGSAQRFFRVNVE